MFLQAPQRFGRSEVLRQRSTLCERHPYHPTCHLRSPRNPARSKHPGPLAQECPPLPEEQRPPQRRQRGSAKSSVVWTLGWALSLFPFASHHNAKWAQVFKPSLTDCVKDGLEQFTKALSTNIAEAFCHGFSDRCLCIGDHQEQAHRILRHHISYDDP